VGGGGDNPLLKACGTCSRESKFKCKNLREFETEFENISDSYSRARGGPFDEKKTKVENPVTSSLYMKN
jgi:hypothetical protein